MHCNSTVFLLFYLCAQLPLYISNEAGSWICYGFWFTLWNCTFSTIIWLILIVRRLYIVLRVAKLLETAHIRVQKVLKIEQRTPQKAFCGTGALNSSFTGSTYSFFGSMQKPWAKCRLYLKMCNSGLYTSQGKSCLVAALNLTKSHTSMLIHIVCFFSLGAPWDPLYKLLRSYNWPPIPPWSLSNFTRNLKTHQLEPLYGLLRLLFLGWSACSRWSVFIILMIYSSKHIYSPSFSYKSMLVSSRAYKCRTSAPSPCGKQYIP